MQEGCFDVGQVTARGMPLWCMHGTGQAHLGDRLPLVRRALLDHRPVVDDLRGTAACELIFAMLHGQVTQKDLQAAVPCKSFTTGQ